MDNDLRELLEIDGDKAGGSPSPSAGGGEAPVLDPVVVRQKRRALGLRNMFIGGIWCVGGTLVTVISYNAAVTSPGGGQYLIAWGAILFGGLQSLKGLFQFATA